MPEWVSNPRSPTFQADSFNHCTRAPASTSVTHIKWGDSNVGVPFSHGCHAVFPQERPIIFAEFRFSIPANTKHLYNMYTMLDQRSRSSESDFHPSKYKMLSQCWFSVGPQLSTSLRDHKSLTRCWVNDGPTAQMPDHH